MKRIILQTTRRQESHLGQGSTLSPAAAAKRDKTEAQHFGEVAETQLVCTCGFARWASTCQCQQAILCPCSLLPFQSPSFTELGWKHVGVQQSSQRFWNQLDFFLHVVVVFSNTSWLWVTGFVKAISFPSNSSLKFWNIFLEKYSVRFFFFLFFFFWFVRRKVVCVPLWT